MELATPFDDDLAINIGGAETLILGCVSLGRVRLLSFVIDRIISNAMTDDTWPTTNDE
jgi:hypothetical protein